jgi:rSAM/selenodomain-associated transferase 1
MSAPDDRVLAIMMKAPRAGQVKTRLAGAHPPDEILNLYRALVEDTIDLSRRMGVRTVAICPAGDETPLAQWLPRDVDVVPQRGVGLAEALRTTFEQLCADRQRRVIAFNADSPHLSAGALQAAFDALLTADLVVGPCDDGGYYLVGARRPYDDLFDAMALGRKSACELLLAAAARRNLRVVLSERHYDIDLPDDLVRLARELTHDPKRAPRTAALLASWALARQAGS